MKVLVTGSAGRLGSATCRALLDAGFEVRGADQRYAKDLDIDQRIADLRDHLEVYRVMHGMDAVVHLANYPYLVPAIPPQVLFSENVAMNANMFQAAHEMGVKRLVFASSIQAMSGDRESGQDRPSGLKYLPIDGAAPALAANAYALSKTVGEQMLRYHAERDAQAACTAIRFPYLVATGSGWRVGRRDGKLRPGVRLDEGFAYLYVTDAGRLVADILRRQRPGYHQYLPGAATPYLPGPLADLAAEYFRGVELRRPIAEMTSFVDNSGITADVGWEPRETLPVEEDARVPAAVA